MTDCLDSDLVAGSSIAESYLGLRMSEIVGDQYTGLCGTMFRYLNGSSGRVALSPFSRCFVPVKPRLVDFKNLIS